MEKDIKKFIPGARVIKGESGNQWHGVVVFNNTLGVYSPEYLKKDWGYLGNGFMIDYVEVGLVYAKDIDDEIIVPD